MYDIFLSYSSQDRGRLQPLFAALEQQGWSVFWDHESIHTGENWSLKIETAINNSRCVVVVWSKHSIHSEWVREEATVGKRRDVLLPLLLDGVEPPVGFLLRQADDFNRWNGKPSHPAFVRLAAQVYKRLNGVEPPPPPLSPVKPRWPLYAGVAAVVVAATGSYQLLPTQGSGVKELTSKPLSMAATPATSALASGHEKTYHLIIMTTPDDAIVTVDGRPYSSDQLWRAGTYEVNAVAKGFQGQTWKVTIGDHDIRTGITLKELNDLGELREPIELNDDVLRQYQQ